MRVEAKPSVRRRGQIIRPVIELEVRDKNGKLIEKRRLRGHSLLMNFFNMFYGLLGEPNVTSASITTTSDTSETLETTYPPGNRCSPWYNIGLTAGQGNDNFGLVVGSGTATPTLNDYKLETPIANGTESGQLEYGATTVNSPSCGSSSCNITVVRTFTNGTSNAITVNEIGLIAQYNSCNDHIYYYLIARDVLSSSVSVPANSTLTVRYIFEFTI